MKKLFILSLLVIFSLNFAYAQLTHSGNFNHIGAVESNDELAFVKAQIDAGAEPWASEFNEILNWAVAGNTANVGAGENGPRDLCKQAYANALAWHYTDNVTYANQAVNILNAWANNFTGYNVTPGQSSQDLLVGAWIGTLLGPAAELMRDYAGWTAAQQTTMSTMFENAFYPAINQMSTWNGNVDLTQIQAMLAIATFNEDATEFNAGLARLELRNPAYYYLSTDDPASRNYGGSSDAAWGSGSAVTLWTDGLTQETCRDNGHHAQFAMAATLAAAEIAWHQGVDAYTEYQTRYVAVLELMAIQLTSGNMQGTCADNVTNPDRYNTFEIGYNHYHNRMGIAMPNTQLLIESNVSKNGACDWNIFYETLTHNGVGGTVSNNPRALSATLAPDGQTITLVFSKDLTTVNTATELANFTVNVNDVSAAITSLTHATATTLEFVVATPLIYSDVVTIDYAGGTITSTDTEILEAFTDRNVTNQVAAPSNMVVDGETGIITNFQTAWFAFDDANDDGLSTTTPAVNELFTLTNPGANGTDSSAFINFTLDQGGFAYAPFVGLGFDLSLTQGEAFDLTGTTGITFWHIGEACNLTINMTSVVDYCTYRYPVNNDATWTEYTLTWNQFTQPAWGVQVAFDESLITAFQWQVEGATGDAGTLGVDEVALTGATINFPTPQLTTQTLALNEGWNLISFYVTPTVASIATVFAGIDYKIIKTEDAFNSTNAPTFANSLRDVEAGVGYLIEMNTSETLIVQGTPSVAVIDPTTIDNGWGIIATTNETPEAISNYFDATNATTVKDFNGFWEPNSALNSLTEFEAGKAYFINKQ